MKIVILNGSPRVGGNTQMMIDTFVQSLSHQHHYVVLNVALMSIKGCKGCRYCYSHQGECFQKDDMDKVYMELKDADMVVFASPIYWFDMSAQLKTVIDRLYAFGSTCFSFHQTALFLNAGADHVFDAAIAQYKMMSSYLKWEDKGIIVVPHMINKGSMATCEQLEQVKELAQSL